MAERRIEPVPDFLADADSLRPISATANHCSLCGASTPGIPFGMTAPVPPTVSTRSDPGSTRRARRSGRAHAMV